MIEFITVENKNVFKVFVNKDPSTLHVKWKIREQCRTISGQRVGYVSLKSSSDNDLSLQTYTRTDADTAVPAQVMEHTSSFINSNGSSYPIISPTTGRFSKEASNKLSEQEVDTPTCEDKLKNFFFLFQVTQEECLHRILVENLCSECGETVLELHTQSSACVDEAFQDYASYTPWSTLNGSTPDLLVSSETSKQMDLEKVNFLLQSKKLPLVLDLDNTLLHAYPFPPPLDVTKVIDDKNFRVVSLNDPLLYLPYKPFYEKALGQSTLNQQDLVYPHYDVTFSEDERKQVEKRWESWVISVVSSETYQSNDSTENFYHAYPCYFKLRPGVLEFLRESSKKFELYLFTAGAAIHAMSSLRVLDPERRWFGSRVFTREDLPYSDNGALGLKTVQRIFPGEFSTQNLVTIVDDCESVWSPDSNLFKVHAYHWWPDPSLHPFLLLYCRRTPNGAGSHSEVPVKIVDPGAFSRIRAAAFSMLNFCPSIIEMCKSPRRIMHPDMYSSHYATSNLDGGHSSTIMPIPLQVDNITQIASEKAQPAEDLSQSFSSNSQVLNPSPLANTNAYSQNDDCVKDERRKNGKENANVALNCCEMEEKTKNASQPSSSSPCKKQCTSWLDKGFEKRMKGESQEELNARVLKVTTENWKAPYIVKDTDCQLKYLLAILNEMHERFFSQVSGTCFDHVSVQNLPSVKSILDSMRQAVLQDVILQATGIREASIPDFHETDLGRSIIALGGQLVAQSHSTQPVTHLLVGKETKYYFEACKNETFPFSAHLMWLEAALFTFKRYDESLFTVDRCENQYRVFWDALYGFNNSSTKSSSLVSSQRISLPFEDTQVVKSSENTVESQQEEVPLDELFTDNNFLALTDIDTLENDLLNNLD